MNLLKSPNKSSKRQVETFKKWCDELPYLKFNADEEWLMVFLHNCKFKLEAAKSKIETFYIMRHVMPDLFTTRETNLPKVQEILKKGLIVPMKQSESDQKTILYFSFGDPERYPITLLLKTYFMVLDVILMDESSKFFEYDLLIDLKHFSPKYEEGLSANAIKILLRYFEEGYPLNVKNIHFINPPPCAMPILNLTLMFMPEKKRAKVHVYCENEDFEITQLYPLLGTIFSVDEDGTRRVFNDVCIEWILKMANYRKWLLQSAFLFSLDMSQRPPDGKTFFDPFHFEDDTNDSLM